MYLRHKSHLFANMTWSLVGQLIYNASQWLLVLTVARQCGAANVGTFVLAFSICSPVIMLCNLRMNMLLLSEPWQNNNLFDYIGLQTLMSGVAVVLISIMAFAICDDTVTRWIVILIACAKGIEALSSICQTFAQKEGWNIYVARSQLLKSILGVTSFWFMISQTDNLLLGSFVLTIVWLGMLLLHDLKVAAALFEYQMPRIFTATLGLKKLVNTISIINLKALFWMGLPLGMTAGLNSLNTNLPRYMISNVLGREVLGLFSPCSYIFNIALVAFGMLIAPTVPLLTDFYRSGDKKAFYQLLHKLVGLAVVLGLVGIGCAELLGADFILLLFGPEFVPPKHLLSLLMLAALLNFVALIFIYLVTSMRALRIQMLFFLLCIVVSYCGMKLLINSHQLFGVVWAEVISGFVLMCCFASCALYYARSRWRDLIFTESLEVYS